MSDDFFAVKVTEETVPDVMNLLTVGQVLDINANDSALQTITIGMGWDFTKMEETPLDLDIVAFCLNTNGQTNEDQDFVFFNNETAHNGAIKHHGDSRTGAGDGDDENITIKLRELPFTVSKIVFVISLYNGIENRQNLSMTDNAFIRLIHTEKNYELGRFILDDLLANHQETCMVVGYLEREGAKWLFSPRADFVKEGLAKIAKDYGLVIINQ